MATIETLAPRVTEETRERRLLIAAPKANDADALGDVLRRAGIESTVCTHADDLCNQIESGATAAIVAEEFLTPRAADRLRETLSRQPEWSDFPVIVMMAPESRRHLNGRPIDRLGGHNYMIFLERPLRKRVLLSSVSAAINSRLRQYQVRDELADRQRMLDVLRESEHRFRLMADSAPVLIWVSDEQKKGVYFNEGWLKFTGRTMEQEVGEGWLDSIHPDDLNFVAQKCRGAFERREPFRMEFRMRRADGEYRWVLDQGAPRFREDGTLAGYVGTCVDISDLKQAQVALRKSEHRYRAIVEGHAEMLCRFRPGGEILFVNGAYARSRGTTPEALIGTNFWKFVAKEDRPHVRRMLEQLSPESPEVSIENRFETESGRCWTLWTNRALAFDAVGRATEVQSSGIDITRRKRAEEALRESEQRLQLAMRTSRMFVWTWDLRSGEIHHSDRGAEILGFIAPYHESVAWDAIHPDDVERVRNAVAQAMIDHSEMAIDCRMIRPDNGRQIWIHVRGTIECDENGAPARMFGTTADITERKMAEETRARLAAIVKSTDDAVISMSLDGRIESWNASAERMYGYTATEAIGRPVQLIIPPEIRQKETSILERLKRGESISHFETVRLAKDGRRLDIALTISPVRDEVGRVIGASKVARDITHQKRAEQALRENEERLRLAFDAGRMGSWEWSPQSNRVIWSPTLEAIHGLAPGTFGGTFEDYQRDIHPDDRDKVKDSIIRAIEGGDVLHNEYRIIWPDGSLRWVEGRGKVFRDESGAPVRVIGICADITERKRAEAALRESEQRARATFNQAAVGMAVADLSGRFLETNDKFSQILGYTSDELRGLTALDITHPDDRAETRRHMRRLLEGEISNCVEEKRYFRKDGSEVWSLTTVATVKDESGKPQRFIGVVEDISMRKRAENALRESEARMRIAQQATRWGVFEYDYKTGKNYWSPELEALFGLDPGTFEGTSEGWIQRLHPEDRDRAVQAAEDALQTGHYAQDFRVVWDDGSVHWIFARAKVFKDNAGQPLRMLGVNVDITERKWAEAALKAKEAELDLVAKTTPLILTRCSRDLRYVFANRAAADLFGLTPEQMVDKPIVDMMGQKAFSTIKPYVDRVLEGEPVEFETQINYPAAGPRWVRANYMPDRNERGEVAGWIASIVDITDLQQAQDLLRIRARQQEAVAKLGEFALRERNLQTLFDHATAIVAETLQFEYGKLFELLPGGERFLLRAGVGWKPGLVGAATIGADSDTLAGYTLVQEGPVIVTDLPQETRFTGPPLLFEHGVVSGITCIIRGSDGRAWGILGADAKRPVHVTQDDMSFLVSVANILSDAIQHAHFEQALRDSEERFREVANNINQFAWTCDPSGSATWYNQRWYDYTGTTFEEMKDWGWKKLHHPDHVDRVVKRLQKCFDTGEPWEDTFPLRGKDGTYRWFLSRAQPIRDAEGKVVRWFGTNTDISEQVAAENALRESEARFAAFMQNLPGAAWMKDLDLHYVYANKEAERVFNTTFERLRGMTDADLFPPATARQFRENDLRVLKGKSAIQTVENLRQADGLVHRSIVNKFTVSDIDGNPAFVGGVAIDVTERLAAEEALRVSEARYRHLIESLPAAVYVCDAVGRIILHNNAAVELWGRVPDPQEDRWTGACRMLETDGTLISNDFSPVAMAVKQKRPIAGAEIIIERPDGTRRSVLANPVPIFVDGRIVTGAVNMLIDITERKRARDAELEALARLSAVVDTAVDGIITIDERGTIETVNAAAQNLFGYFAEDLIGRNVSMLMPEPYRTEHDGYLCSYLKTGERKIIGIGREVRGRRKDASEFPMDLSVSEIHLDGRRLFTGIVRDISQRHEAERALRESETRFRLMADSAPNLIWMSGIDATYTWFNRRWLEYTGRTLEQEVGDGWAEGVHPDDLEQCIQTYRTAFDKRSSFEMVYRLRRYDGKYRWFSDAGVPIRLENGVFAGYIGSCIDVTERRMDEEALRERVTQRTQALIAANRELEHQIQERKRVESLLATENRILELVVTSASLENLLESLCDEMENLIPNSYCTIRLKPARANTSERDPARIITAGVDVFGSLVKDGVYPPLITERTVIPHLESDAEPTLRDQGVKSYWLEPIVAPGGTIVGTLGVYRTEVSWPDENAIMAAAMATRLAGIVVERARTEARSAEQLAQLAHVGRLATMGEMASGLAHELNQPLCSIVNYTEACIELVQRKAEYRIQITEALGDVARQAERAGEVIRRLRDFVKRRQPSRSAVDMNSIVHEVVAFTGVDARQSEVRVRVKLPKRLPQVYADSIQIEQVLVNLVRNACEAMRDSGQNIRVLTVETARRRGLVEVKVGDNGPGIPEDVKERLFEPFFTTKHDGMGMGLSITRSIIEIHDGTIWVTSNEHGGTTFHFVLPTVWRVTRGQKHRIRSGR